MATEKEIIQMEILRRKDDLANLEQATVDLQEAKTQFFDLDTSYKNILNDKRDTLESVYREKRHYDALEPRVFTEEEAIFHPYFKGPADDDGSPYYRLSAVTSGQDLGISPQDTPPTNTNGKWNRVRSYEPTEDVARVPASAALSAYPDLTGEPLPANFPAAQENVPAGCTGETPPGSGTDETTCLANGGTWTPASTVDDPIWVAEETAPEVLKIALDPWRRDLVLIRDDVHEQDTATVQFYQDVIDKIDEVIALLPPAAVFVRATGNPDPEDWGQTPVPTGALDTALTELIQYADVDVPSTVTSRDAFLVTEGEKFEGQFFTFVNMRIHAVNGSYSKYITASNNIDINKELIADHIKVIADLEIILQDL